MLLNPAIGEWEPSEPLLRDFGFGKQGSAPDQGKHLV